MHLKLAAGLGSLLLAGSAMAQVPPDIAAQLRERGQSMDPAVGQLYEPLFADESYADILLTRNIAYGADPLQKLDLYVPEDLFVPGKGKGPLPVLVFVHGGGFVRGDKHGTFYPDNITAWAARHGMVGVGINYRLAPDHPWPGGAEDLRAALGWVRANIAEHGGDPDRIVLWGHSAGANHVADYVGHTELHGDEAKGLKGAILLSPNYADEEPAEPHVYYGADASLQTLQAAIARLNHAATPLFVGFAEFDPDPMRHTAQQMIADLCTPTGPCSASVDLPDHNHFTEGMAVGTDDVSLSAPLLDWSRKVAGE